MHLKAILSMQASLEASFDLLDTWQQRLSTCQGSHPLWCHTQDLEKTVQPGAAESDLLNFSAGVEMLEQRRRCLIHSGSWHLQVYVI